MEARLRTILVGCAVGIFVACMTLEGEVARSASLVVGDAGSKTILRYPLVKGLPSASPQSDLELGYPPSFIAVGPDGAIYVADSKADAVYVYGAHAVGKAPPMRQLRLGAPPRGLAVDGQGYLYVAGLVPDAIEIYAPRAHGAARPAATLQLPMVGGTTKYIVLDPAGRAFVGEAVPSIGWVVSEYADPRTAPVFIRLFAPLDVTALCVDAAHETYVGTPIGINGSLQQFAPTMAGGFPDLQYDRETQPDDAKFIPTGVVVEGQHAFVTSAGNDIPPALYALDVFGGSQTPLAVVAGGKLGDPIGLALAP
jgi:hypothetical protein